MNDMVWLAGSDAIDNFPITKYQTKKYYVTQPCKVAGSLQQRHTSNSQFHAHKPTHEKRMSKSDDTLYDKLEYRNLKIGIEIGTDVFGPAYGLCVSVFVDKACGFGKSNYYKHNSKSDIKHASDNSDNTSPNYVLESIKWCHNYYTKYGHTIHTLCSDSINVYRSKKLSDLCDELKITQRFSPPGSHAYNGLVESYNKVISNKVTSMYCLAPYVPHQHWPKLWDTAEIINNLRKSRIPGSHITRWEEFTQERPNYKTMVILPIGIPIEYFVPTESRNNSFAFHSRLGMYMGPDLLSPGSITIWNPDTKRFIRQNTYRILSYQQAPYDWKPLDPFTTVRTPKIYDKQNTLVANVEEEDTEKLNSPIFKEALPRPILCMYPL